MTDCMDKHYLSIFFPNITWEIYGQTGQSRTKEVTFFLKKIRDTLKIRAKTDFIISKNTMTKLK